MNAQTTATPMYPDAYLDDRADEFVALGLAERGVTLLQYLEAPDRYRPMAGAFRPLLPAQRDVQARLDAETEAAEQALEAECPAAECRGGALVEPLHHHAYGTRRVQSNFTRRAKA